VSSDKGICALFDVTVLEQLSPASFFFHRTTTAMMMSPLPQLLLLPIANNFYQSDGGLPPPTSTATIPVPAHCSPTSSAASAGHSRARWRCKRRHGRATLSAAGRSCRVAQLRHVLLLLHAAGQLGSMGPVIACAGLPP
jgi:hypothetical protein